VEGCEADLCLVGLGETHVPRFAGPMAVESAGGAGRSGARKLMRYCLFSEHHCGCVRIGWSILVKLERMNGRL